MDADISGCFDNIDHDSRIRKLRHFPGRLVIEKWLKAGIFYNGVWSESGGTVQGALSVPLYATLPYTAWKAKLGETQPWWICERPEVASNIRR